MRITIRELQQDDENIFIVAVKSSRDLHYPWVTPPQTPQEFRNYFQRSQQINQKSFVVLDAQNNLVGVYNLSEIVSGAFHSAYLGYYAMNGYAGLGYMSAALKMVVQLAFTELGLHRLEANIQPENLNSINLVKRNGFNLEGYSPRYLRINGEWRDHERWAILSDSWCVAN